MWVVVSENKCLNFLRMFLNSLKSNKLQNYKTRVVRISVTSKVISQGSGSMLSYWSRVNAKLNKLKAEKRLVTFTRGKVVKNLVYIRTKKTHQAMSLGPIAKKKKSLITLGFLQKTYRLNSKLFINKNLPISDRYVSYLCKLPNNYKTASVKTSFVYRSCII